MDTIVCRLSEIEGAATAIVKNAEEQKQVMEDAMLKKRDAFDQQLEAQTQKKIDAIQSELESELKKSLEKQQAESDATIAKLKKDYDDNHSKYAQQILDHIIEV